jgi:S-methylmethionine-dependent homocysteine/selenocysteine methylase
MARYREKLPQSSGNFFLTDGGIETYLIFQKGIDLSDFAAFPLLKSPAGRAVLRDYFRNYAELARRYQCGLILESPTWRANPDWAKRLAYSKAELAEANVQAIDLLRSLREEYESEQLPVVLSGCIGPRGDGYQPANLMSAEQAQAYHSEQIETFAKTEADLVTAITMNYVEEALGIARAAAAARMPAAIAFTVETDGRLPTGQTLREAVESVDAATGRSPVYYMVNCAHPTHFAPVLSTAEPWLERIWGLRANASAKSHAELNESANLDEGSPEEFGRQHRELFDKLKSLRVFGGCCGTDHRHVEAGVREIQGSKRK